MILDVHLKDKIFKHLYVCILILLKKYLWFDIEKPIQLSQTSDHEQLISRFCGKLSIQK